MRKENKQKGLKLVVGLEGRNRSIIDKVKTINGSWEQYTYINHITKEKVVGKRYVIKVDSIDELLRLMEKHSVVICQDPIDHTAQYFLLVDHPAISL